MHETVLISGDAHPRLGRDLAHALGIVQIPAAIAAFADGETRIRIADSLHGKHVLIVQGSAPPANERLMTLSLLADAARGAGAAHICAVMPYFAYARQDVRDGGPLSAALAARLLAAASIDRVVTLELHAAALESAFPMPMLNLRADALLLPAIEAWARDDFAIVAPDAGGLKRAQRYAIALKTPLAVVTKCRSAADISAAHALLGDVKGRRCLIVDDMVSTGGTIANAAAALLTAGAAEVHALFVHAVLAPGALARMRAAGVRRIVTTDSIARDPHPDIEVVAIARFLAQALRRDMTSAPAAINGL